MKIIKLKCKCGIFFDRKLSEYNRQIRNGRNTFYCTLSCSGRYGKGYEFLKNWRSSEKNKEHLKQFRKRDKYSPYRTHLREVRHRIKTRGWEKTDITLEYLKNIFEKQAGKCIYTGVKLIHPIDMIKKDYIYMASLDRIDNNKSYKIDNVQFISVCMNFAKKQMSHEKAKEFIKVIRKNEL